MQAKIYWQLQMALVVGICRVLIPVGMRNSYALRTCFSQIGAQVYYNEDPNFYNQKPIELIIKSQQKNKFIGSSTMVVITLYQNQLKSCYIGDSGFIVIRVINTKPFIIYQFTEQQHAFNFPFQLSMSKYNGDNPKQSICVSIDIREDDIIVVGTDGLFDNIFIDQILATIEDTLLVGKWKEDQLQKLTKLFAQQSIQRGKNQSFKSPFSQKANNLGINYLGGKLDDTTVIIAKIDKIKGENKASLFSSENL